MARTSQFGRRPRTTAAAASLPGETSSSTSTKRRRTMRRRRSYRASPSPPVLPSYSPTISSPPYYCPSYSPTSPPWYTPTSPSYSPTSPFPSYTAGYSPAAEAYSYASCGDNGGSDGENGVEEDDERQADEEGEEAPAPAPQPHVAAVEDYSDDDRPIRVVVHRGSSAITINTVPAPAAPPQSPPAPAPAAPPESWSRLEPSSPHSSSSVIRNVTVENFSAFDCSICYLPLKSPIFQCHVGHVVCSPCHDKLKLGQAKNCHVCRVPLPGGYFRCNAMEQVMDSIRFPCPHDAHGCAETALAYHGREAHARTCVHKPCHCPGEGCGFAGSVRTTLLEHFAAVHGWTCTAARTTAGTTTRGRGGSFDVSLCMGFNVVVVTAAASATAGADQEGIITTTTSTEQQYTLVLNMERLAPVCNSITAFCIHPSNTGVGTLMLSTYYRRRRRRDSDDLSSTYLQTSLIMCTDLSNGIPAPVRSFPFLVPRPSPRGEHDDNIRVRVSYIAGTGT